MNSELRLLSAFKAIGFNYIVGFRHCFVRLWEICTYHSLAFPIILPSLRCARIILGKVYSSVIFHVPQSRTQSSLAFWSAVGR